MGGTGATRGSTRPGRAADPAEALGHRLRRAVEMLLGAFGRTDRSERAAGRPGLEPATPAELYHGAVTAVMRVLVLAMAEQRGLLSNSLGTLRAELDRPAAPGGPGTGTAWHRLNAPGAGAPANHPAPASPFDPDPGPWLRLPVDDDTVAHLLRAVHALAPQLDVEHIGHGYEQLLSCAAVRADTVLVGLAGRPDRVGQVPLADLTALAARHRDRRALAGALVARFRSAGLGSVAAVAGQLAPLDPTARTAARAALLAMTGGDRGLVARLLPFARLIRNDLAGRPVLTLPGAPCLVDSELRRRTGTHYTPRALADDVVRHALQPLLYRVGPLQTADRSRWEPKSDVQLLELRVADIAMGSGAFLVAAARHLADALHAARVRAGRGDRSRSAARRQVVMHCLYGVDVNPMAVRMAKLSLWLLVADPGCPPSVLDDRLLAGDALLGVTEPAQPAALLDLPAGRPGPADDRRRAQLVADLAVGAALAGRVRFRRGTRPAPELGIALRSRRAAVAGEGRRLARQVLAGGDPAAAVRRSRQWLATDQVPGAFERRPVHWPLAFPEVFARGGFDAVVGNPPFLGGQRLTAALGRAYRELLVDTIGGGTRGSADLVAYFLLRAHQLLHPGGQTGLIATNTLAQGDTREVGLDRLVAGGTTIRRALRSERWPAPGASLEYCAVWTSRARPAADTERQLGGVPVPAISSALQPAGPAGADPRRLAGNARRCFIGSYVLGLGFTMSPARARELLAADPGHADVLFPYLGGHDLNRDPAAAAARWVINFHDWPEERARRYPACYAQVRDLVRPERERNPRPVYRRYWWHYGEKRPALTRAIAGLPRVVVIALVSRTVMPAMVSTGQVLSHKLGVFASADPALLAVLSSAPHFWWARSRSSTIKADTNYSPSDVFETLPLPELTPELRTLGDHLDRYRRALMLRRGTGLTATYNLVADPAVRDEDVAELRRIHRALDEAVVCGYGWPDLAARLDHGFHPAGRELRYTVGPGAQRAMLDRLLVLNHERHAAEAAGPSGGAGVG